VDLNHIGIVGSARLTSGSIGRADVEPDGVGRSGLRRAPPADQCLMACPKCLAKRLIGELGSFGSLQLSMQRLGIHVV